MTLALVVAACTQFSRREESIPADWQRRVAQSDREVRASNFPMPPEELENVMSERRLEIREAERTNTGVMGAFQIEVYFPESDVILDFKWKRAPNGGEGWNNSPRLEIAAYEIQKWFLSPEAYVVPTVVARCIPLSGYEPIDPDAKPNIPGTRCVLGALSVWLEDVEAPDVQLDEDRFYRDGRYARAISEYNLLTYLIRNRDTRVGNQLVSSSRESPRVYSVDNGITFGTFVHNAFRYHFDAVRVPGLPRSDIDRLREVGQEAFEALRVLAEFEIDREGEMRSRPPSAPIEGEGGVRVRGGTVQLGLEPDEIEELRVRVKEVIEAVDQGKIPAF